MTRIARHRSKYPIQRPNGRKKVDVKLGISNGVKTEIVSGLNEKQQVVLQ